MTYIVDQWGSHPDNDNDDCWTGREFSSLAEARAYLESSQFPYDTAYLVLDGPGIHEVRPNPNSDPEKVARDRRADDAEWRREVAMEAGMAFGCDGWNEVMGY